MSGLRQRKAGITTAKETGDSSNNRKRNDKAVVKKKNEKKRGILILVFILIVYLPLLAVVNPITIQKWFSYAHYYFWNDDDDDDRINSCNSPDSSSCCIDTDRLVFVRIPKTASTSLLELFSNNNYSATIVNLGELDDVVSSIPLINKGAAVDNTQGYHDPATRQSRFRQFYKKASRTILYYSSSQQQQQQQQQHNNVLFQGHLHYFDFEKYAPLYYPNTTTTTTTTTTSILPNWILNLYGRQYPQGPFDVPQFTMLRNPQLRLASMYHYDRYGARNEAWRHDFREKRGNLTLQECLQQQSCTTQNDFAKWCNLQTEMLCGPDCLRGDSQEALNQAKANLKTHFLFVGITERLEESLQLISRIVPSYYLPRDTTSSEILPHAKQSQRPAFVSDESSLTKLKEICRFDQELYEYANELLTKQLQECITNV